MANKARSASEQAEKKRAHILMPVVLRKRSDTLGQLQFARDSAAAVALEELRDDDSVVRDRVGPKSVVLLERTLRSGSDHYRKSRRIAFAEEL